MGAGSYSDYPGFGQICVDKLLTLVIDPHRNKPMAQRISNQDGVSVCIKNYGTTESVLDWLYEPMFGSLEGLAMSGTSTSAWRV